MLINKKKIHLFFGNRKTLFKMNFNKRNFKLLLLYKIYKSHQSMRNISSYKIRLKMEFYQSYTINARLKMINSPTDTSHPLIKPLNFVFFTLEWDKNSDLCDAVGKWASWYLIYVFRILHLWVISLFSTDLPCIFAFIRHQHFNLKKKHEPENYEW